MSERPKEIIPMEYIQKYGARAGDEYIKDKNIAANATLCKRCDGTGNELYNMYSACAHCDGTGANNA